MMLYNDYVNIINGDFKPGYMKREIKESNLNIDVLYNARVTKSSLSLPSKVMDINIADSNGDICHNVHHLRGPNHDVFKFTNTKVCLNEDAEYLKGEFIYLGWIFPHYGHFLMETLSRLWVLNEVRIESKKFIFNYYGNGKNVVSQKSWAKDFLSCFGIKKEQLMFVEGDLILEKVYIPSQSMILHDSVNINAQSFIWKSIHDRYIDDKKEPFRKIYLSRRGLSKDNRVLTNELELEEKLKQLGFEIVYPEKIPISEQVSILSETRVLIGPSGSALHNAAFMQPGTHVISLTTPKFCLLNEVLCCLSSKTNYSIFLGQEKELNTWTIDIKALTSHLCE